MARPRADDYEEKRRHVRETAARLFSTRSYGSVSIADIAKACGVAKSVIYHYHGAKEDILYELLDEHIRFVLVAARRARGEGPAPEARLRAFAQALIEIYIASPDSQTLLNKELHELGGERRRRIEALMGRLVEETRELLAALGGPRMRERRWQKPMVMLFFGTINWTYTWYDRKGSIAPGELADAIADLYLAGLAAPPRPAARKPALATT
jgi:AcrR family transcriptional regulator